MKQLATVVLIALVSFSCSRTSSDENPDMQEPSTQPVPYLVDTLLLDLGSYCFIETPLIYEDKLIVMITNSDTQEGWINCYDKSTLELRWRWQEAMDEFGVPAKGFGRKSYVYNGILAIAQANLSYGIDIETGNTIWKNRNENSGVSAVFGYTTILSTFTFVDSKIHYDIEIADITDGNWETIFEFKKQDTLDVALGTPLPFSFNETNYLAFVSTKWIASAQTRINKLNLYNLTEEKLEWTSDTIPLKDPLSGTPGVQPKFEDGQILLGNDAIYSYNVEDGTLEWWKWYGNSFVLGPSHLTVADGVVYANNDSQFMVGLDVHTGEEIINTTTGGSVSPIAYHDGKCYMSSVTDGGTNRLMIIDAQSGEIVQNVKAPFRPEDRSWTFERAISVDPESGLVYTADHKYLLVYDFED